MCNCELSPHPRSSQPKPPGKLQTLKAALKDIFILTMSQLTVCNVKGVAPLLHTIPRRLLAAAHLFISPFQDVAINVFGGKPVIHHTHCLQGI